MKKRRKKIWRMRFQTFVNIIDDHPCLLLLKKKLEMERWRRRKCKRMRRNIKVFCIWKYESTIWTSSFPFSLSYPFKLHSLSHISLSPHLHVTSLFIIIILLPQAFQISEEVILLFFFLLIDVTTCIIIIFLLLNIFDMWLSYIINIYTYERKSYCFIILLLSFQLF